jgi:hypothetical protein
MCKQRPRYQVDLPEIVDAISGRFFLGRGSHGTRPGRCGPTLEAWAGARRRARRELAAEDGPRPEQAVTEARSVLIALAKMGVWSGPRGAVSALCAGRPPGAPPLGADPEACEASADR